MAQAAAEISPEVLDERWEKKKTNLRELAKNIRALRWNVSRDLKSDDEKTFLTALVVAIMDKTGERVGNEKSAKNGRHGVTVFRKKHVDIIGNKVLLEYVGKSSVEHDMSFSDAEIAKALKKAKKNSPSKFVFVTSDGFKIKADRVTRYVEPYGITPKDLRGYAVNSLIVKKLSGQEIPKEEKHRKKLFNKTLKSVAKKIQHGAGTLKNNYLVPELSTQYIENGTIINLKELGWVKEGGEMNRGGETTSENIPTFVQTEEKTPRMKKSETSFTKRGKPLYATIYENAKWHIAEHKTEHTSGAGVDGHGDLNALKAAIKEYYGDVNIPIIDITNLSWSIIGQASDIKEVYAPLLNMPQISFKEWMNNATAHGAKVINPETLKMAGGGSMENVGDATSETFSIEWYDGSKSSSPISKDKIIDVVNKWITGETGWVQMTVKNNKTEKKEIVTEDKTKTPISNLSIISGGGKIKKESSESDKDKKLKLAQAKAKAQAQKIAILKLSGKQPISKEAQEIIKPEWEKMQEFIKETDEKLASEKPAEPKEPKPISLKNLNRLADILLSPVALEYNEEGKREFGMVGKKAMKELAQYLGLKEYKVSFNPAGIAVSGDVYLDGMFDEQIGVHININKSPFTRGKFYYRTINKIDYPRKDGGNNWADYEILKTPDKFRENILRLVGKLEEKQEEPEPKLKLETSGVRELPLLDKQQISEFIKKNNIHFYTDGAHGWLRVPLDLIKKLKLQDKITGYSYADNNYGYLEEDLDLGTFLSAVGIGYYENEPEHHRGLRQHFWESVQQTDTSTSNRTIFIRNLNSIADAKFDCGGEMPALSEAEMGTGGTLTASDIQFENGKAVIKDGRRIVAKIYNRPVYNAFHNIKSTYSEKYPFVLEMAVGSRECETLEECVEIMNKYMRRGGEVEMAAGGGFSVTAEQKEAERKKDLALFDNVWEQIKNHPQAQSITGKGFDGFHKLANNYYYNGVEQKIDEDRYLYFEPTIHPFRNEYFEAFNNNLGVGYYIPRKDIYTRGIEVWIKPRPVQWWEREFNRTGGELYSHKHLTGVTIKLISPTIKGWKVEQINEFSPSGKKLTTPKVKTTFFSNSEIEELFEKKLAHGGSAPVPYSTDIPYKSVIEDTETLFPAEQIKAITKVTPPPMRPSFDTFDTSDMDTPASPMKMVAAPVQKKGKSTLGKEDKTRKYVREIDISLKNLADIPNDKLIHSRDVYELLMKIWNKNLLNVQEQFYAVYLDRMNRVIGYDDIGKGGVSSTVADPKIMVAQASKALASKVIIAHNHPSGAVNPSQEDILLTKRIKEALRFLDIVLLDHMIIAPEGSFPSYYSFADEGTLTN